MGSRLGSTLTFILKDTQPRGISAHLHYCWVYQGQTIIQTNNHAVIGRWTSIAHGHNAFSEGKTPQLDQDAQPNMPGGVGFVMPKIATSWDELVAIIHDQGRSATACTA